MRASHLDYHVTVHVRKFFRKMLALFPNMMANKTQMYWPVDEGGKRCSSAVICSEEERKKHSGKRIIDGVYVPALHHILAYNVPKDSEHQRLTLVAHCLLLCRGLWRPASSGIRTAFGEVSG